MHEGEWIDDGTIRGLMASAKSATESEIHRILDRAEQFLGLGHAEVAALLMTDYPSVTQRIFEIAGLIKDHIYGERVVMFAPLYVSDYCVNRCTYCGFQAGNKWKRRRLELDEVRRETKLLVQMGHKRIALEAGEDPENCPIEYILDCLRTIYDLQFQNGEIRRVNVNIAATTEENYRRLKEVGIGTYILFQETYHRETYERVHPGGPKSDYLYHLTAFDRAMRAGIDDVGGGVLFGLYDYRYEVLGLMLHNEHLEREFGVGFHTISVPRICKIPDAPTTSGSADMPAIGAGTDNATASESADKPSWELDDAQFRKLVAILRLAHPFTGMIISTRERPEMRRELLASGISQISGGSAVEVGGYEKAAVDGAQFELADNRSAGEIIEWVMDAGYIPSFCTACYRKSRTGDRFMRLAKSGEIRNVCLPNALLTLKEYALDYGTEGFLQKANALIASKLPSIKSERTRRETAERLVRLEAGERDLYE